jgi:PDZ domain-containing secreted protein
VRRSWSLLLAIVAVTVGVAAVFAVAIASGQVPCALVSTQPACEVALVPGPAEDTLGLVTIDGARTYPAAGELLLTTVAVRENLDLGTWWEARRSATADVVPRETVYPPELDEDETAAQNALLMDDSQNTAALAALDAAGYDVTAAASGAAVAAVETDAVTDELVVGDTITAVDGTSVRDAAELVERVQAGAPGDQVELTVRDVEGRTRTVPVTYGANPSDPELAYVGVLLRTELDLPVEVTIDAGIIGGPIRRSWAISSAVGSAPSWCSASSWCCSAPTASRCSSPTSGGSTPAASGRCSPRCWHPGLLLGLVFGAVLGAADRRQPAHRAPVAAVLRAELAAAGPDPALPGDGRPLPAVADRRHRPGLRRDLRAGGQRQLGDVAAVPRRRGGRHGGPAVRGRPRLLPVRACRSGRWCRPGCSPRWS